MHIGSDDTHRDTRRAKLRPSSPGDAPQLIRDIYTRLLAELGPQHWWPADSPTEVILGAILTQNTAWSNVETALEQLRTDGLIDFAKLRDTPVEHLADRIRASGTYRIKAQRIKAFVDHLWTNHQGSLTRLLSGPLERARAELLSIRGVGPETADAILLYAGQHPTFVVDAYTRRILRRHFLIRPGKPHESDPQYAGAIASEDYDTVRDMFQRSLPENPALYNEYHALLVAVGKSWCRARPICDRCPLECFPHANL